MDPVQKETYLQKYVINAEAFPLCEDPLQEEAVSYASESGQDEKKMTRKLFWMWEFICGEDLTEEAEEYIKDHMNQETPLEW